MTFRHRVDGVYQDYSSLDYDQGQVILRSPADGFGSPIRFECSIDLSSVAKEHFDVNRTDAKVIVLRNMNWRPNQLLKLKREVAGTEKSVGYVFSIQALIDGSVNAISEWPEASLPYVAVALRQMISDQCGVSPKELEYRPNGDYLLSDLYPDDIQLCVISRTQWNEMDAQGELELLFQLNLLGSYLVSDANVASVLARSECHALQHAAIFELASQTSLRVARCSRVLSSEPYFSHYIRVMASEQIDWLSKFMQLYQFIEILKDHALIEEVRSKILSDVNSGALTGYDLRRKLERLSKDGHLIRSLVKDHSKLTRQSHRFEYELFSWFVDEGGDGARQEVLELGDYVYQLRNMLVHRLRAIYEGGHDVACLRKERLRRLISDLEFHVVELMVNLLLASERKEVVQA